MRRIYEKLNFCPNNLGFFVNIVKSHDYQIQRGWLRLGQMTSLKHEDLDEKKTETLRRTWKKVNKDMSGSSSVWQICR